MGGHFWEASLFKGPKGGYPPKIFKYFLDILFHRSEKIRVIGLNLSFYVTVKLKKN